MSGFLLLDFTHGDVPPWLNNTVALTRPLAATMVVAIPALGAFSVGMVTWFSPEAGAAMALNSTDFLKGIPDAAYGAIVAIALGYTAGKTVEAVKAKPPPAGQGSPESGPNQSAAVAVEPDAGLPEYAR